PLERKLQDSPVMARRTATTRPGKHRDRESGAGGKRGTIRVGTASWSDPGFVADWYPPDLPARERLPWYAEHFNLVEVNSSFYALLGEKTVERWVEQTPADFVFDVKLHRLLSRHSTPIKYLPSGLRSIASVKGTKVELTPKLETALTKEFLKNIEPLRSAGKLGALLLQLSPAFGPRDYFLSELDRLVGLLKGYLLAVELRNRHWLDDERRTETIDYFKKHRVTLVGVDSPPSEHFMVMPSVDVVTNPKLAYLRAHGRNVHGYISGRTVPDRFDYDYSTKELKEIAGRAEQLAEVAGTTHIIFNNNKSDYAPRAALRFRKIVEPARTKVST
ncbi:MAG TPA: DUF72 domain-containing protein, partial [Gemmataceae bacterium]|nr:DUF72 domain-containing protein [Gemmataceae bacterium]